MRTRTHLAAPEPEPTIVLGAPFEAEAVSNYLRFWAELIGAPRPVETVRTSPLFGDLLNPTGVLGTGCVWMIVLLVRVEDWNGFASGHGVDDADLGRHECLTANLRRFVETVECVTRLCSAPILVCECPPAADLLAKTGIPKLLDNIHRALSEALASEQVRVVQAAASQGGENSVAALSAAIARAMYSLAGAPCSGVIVNLAGVEPGETLAEFLQVQLKAGRTVLVCGAGERPEEAVLRCSRKAPSGLSGLVYLDDDEQRCRDIERGLKGVLAVHMPAGAEALKRTLESHWVFDESAASRAGSGSPLPRLSATTAHRIADHLADPEQLVAALREWQTSGRA